MTPHTFLLLSLCLGWQIPFSLQQNDVNVASGKTYNQSSKYFPNDLSSKGANGDTSGGYFANCIHTAIGDLSHWWEVDLGQPYPVYNIDLWARTGYEGRLYPFTITVDGQTCASAPASNSRETTVTCSTVLYGQRVRITRQASPSNSDGEKTLNMCEMKIYVCTDGWYGLQCSSTCSPGCQNTTCDRQSAQCSPCNAGYTGSRCADCEDKYYKTGLTCTSCSSDCLNQVCDKTSGTCIACIPGRYGDRCTKTCPAGCQNACDQQTAKCASCKDGWYGDQCTTPCPTGCLNACDQQSGKCASCKDGRRGDNCSIPCPPGCQNACDQQSGLCSPCKTGYEGNSCSECQDRYYTNNSMCSQCSSNCRSRMCDKSTGTCNGCVDGRYGDTCSSDCQTANCQQCDQKTGAVCTQCTLFRQPPNCTEVSDGGDKETINTNALIGSVLGVLLIISIVICIIQDIKLKRRPQHVSHITQTRRPRKPGREDNSCPGGTGTETTL